MPFKTDRVQSVLVFLEKRLTRQFVGQLKWTQKGYNFEYDTLYLKRKESIPLGPELPLTQKKWKSTKLFLSFTDRLPSRENPAYPEYCQAMGIYVEEKDPFILLTTIGKKGPSAFVFEPNYIDRFSGEDLKYFRQMLGMTTREFAYCFDFSQAAIARVELGQSSGREILKRVEIYASFPKVALAQIQRRGGILHTHKREKIESLLA